MIKRNIYKDLKKWKSKIDKKPLLLTGKRQVGKTFIVKEFAKNEYETSFYLNLSTNQSDLDLFNTKISKNDFIERVQLLKNKSITQKTIIIIDEVQENENSLNFAKTWNEAKEQYKNIDLVLTGSWIEAAIAKFSMNFPVGQVDKMEMFPIQIDEFIRAIEGDMMVNYIKHQFIKREVIGKEIHEKLTKIYQNYLIIGGMPEVVNKFVNEENKIDLITEIKDKQSILFSAYRSDLGKYASNSNFVKLNKIYDSLQKNLSKPFNKFMYKAIENKSTQSRNWDTAISLLNLSRVTIPAYEIKKANIPLVAHMNLDNFKLYYSDVGFLSLASSFSLKEILNTGFSFIGWINENYAAIHFQKQFTQKLGYWYANQYEIDFLIQCNHGVVPIDVKSGRAKKSKSINKFIEKYSPKLSIVVSKDNFKYSNKELSIPIYAIHLLNLKNINEYISKSNEDFKLTNFCAMNH